MIPERARLGVVSRHGKGLKTGADPSPISKHFAQARLLIWADDGGWLEIYIEIGVHGVIPKIIFLQHGILEFIAALLHILEGMKIQR
jgi:hypothetical protein